MKFAATDLISIMGTRGSGKSTLSTLIQKAWPKQVVIDPMQEYSDGEVVTSFNNFVSKIRFHEQNNSKKFRIIFHFDPETENEDVLFNAILRVCYNFGNIQIVIEEVQQFTTPHKIEKYLKACIFTGRHKGLSLVFVTQRPGQLNKNILSQCTHVFAGLIHEKNDIEYLKSIFPDAETKLPNMPKGKFLYFSPGKPILLVDNGYKK